MSTRHLVDAQLLDMLETFPPLEFTRETLAAMRSGFAQRERPPAPEGLAVERRSAVTTGKDGNEIPLLVYVPTNVEGPLPAVLHIHGGGYIVGTAEMSDVSNRVTAASVGTVVVSVDYRLAPETPYPGPVEDCYAGLMWLVREAGALGVDTGRIAVMGESAGGGLAAGLALLARDRGEVRLVHQHLIYPMIDDRTCVDAEPHPYVGEFVWTASANHFGWSALLAAAPGSEGIPPYAAASRAENLAGLPATYISVGALDLFLEEDMEYARRLMRAGVPTELHVYPGAFHGFNMMPGAEVSRAFQRDSMTALSRALRR